MILLSGTATDPTLRHAGLRYGAGFEQNLLKPTTSAVESHPHRNGMHPGDRRDLGRRQAFPDVQAQS